MPKRASSFPASVAKRIIVDEFQGLQEHRETEVWLASYFHFALECDSLLLESIFHTMIPKRDPLVYLVEDSSDSEVDYLLDYSPNSPSYTPWEDRLTVGFSNKPIVHNYVPDSPEVHTIEDVSASEYQPPSPAYSPRANSPEVYVIEDSSASEYQPPSPAYSPGANLPKYADLSESEYPYAISPSYSPRRANALLQSRREVYTCDDAWEVWK